MLKAFGSNATKQVHTPVIEKVVEIKNQMLIFQQHPLLIVA